jgi:hypothetical protein
VKARLARPATPLVAIPPSADVLARMASSRALARRLAPQSLGKQMPTGSGKIRVPPPLEVESPPIAPVALPRSEPPPELSAERAFQAGKRLFQAGKLALALADIGRAVELAEGLAEYRLYQEWIEWVQGRTDAAHVAALKATAREAAIHDPNLAFPQLVLGRLALSEGDTERARSLLMFARKLDPTSLETKQYLDQIGPPAPGVRLDAADLFSVLDASPPAPDVENDTNTSLVAELTAPRVLPPELLRPRGLLVKVEDPSEPSDVARPASPAPAPEPPSPVRTEAPRAGAMSRGIARGAALLVLAALSAAGGRAARVWRQSVTAAAPQPPAGPAAAVPTTAAGRVP